MPDFHCYQRTTPCIFNDIFYISYIFIGRYFVFLVSEPDKSTN